MGTEQYKLLHTPEGVRDIYNGECQRKITLSQDLKDVIEKYGFQSIQTPSFEFFDIFSKERGSVASRDMFKFFDREGNTLVLRPDITPSIARCTAKYFKDEEAPIRLSYTGNTFLNNSSHQGKLNETTQLGAELINDGSVEADCEILALTIDCLLKAGLLEFQIEVGHADFFNGLMEEADLDEDEVMQIKGLMESKNLFGIEELVSRKKMKDSLKELLQKLPELFGDLENLSLARKLTSNKKALHALNRLEEILSIMEFYGFKDYITVDLGMLSKYNYYTGIIMKAYTYGTGEPVAQGGRYDNLVGQFGKDAPAVGLVILTDQLLLALSRQKLNPLPKADGILILYTSYFRKEAIELARSLRKKNHKVTMVVSGKAGMERNCFTFCEERGIYRIYAYEVDISTLPKSKDVWERIEKNNEKPDIWEKISSVPRETGRQE